MTKCCNQLDICYDTCGANKYRCDAKFRWCLHSICSDLKRSLGFVSKVEGRLPRSQPLWREQVMAGRGGCGQGALSLPKAAKVCSREQNICPMLVIDGSEMRENTEICPLRKQFCPMTGDLNYLQLENITKHMWKEKNPKQNLPPLPNKQKNLVAIPSAPGCSSPRFKTPSRGQKTFHSQ